MVVLTVVGNFSFDPCNLTELIECIYLFFFLFFFVTQMGMGWEGEVFFFSRMNFENHSIEPPPHSDLVQANLVPVDSILFCRSLCQSKMEQWLTCCCNPFFFFFLLLFV